MRRSLAPVLAGLVLPLLLLPVLVGAAPARADDVEDLIRKNLNPKTFDLDSVDSSFVGTAIQDGQRVQLGHDQVMTLVKDAKSKVTSFKLQSFKLLSKTEDGPFVSAVYESVTEVVMDNKPVNEKAITHDIYERRGGKLWLIYSAEEDTTLSSL